MSTLHIPNPQNDISDLLFSSRREVEGDANNKKTDNTVSFGSSTNDGADDEYYVGPVLVTSSVTVQHGLGMIASRDIQQGECLFVTKAAVSVDVDEVYKEWNQQQSQNSSSSNGHTTTTNSTLLEQISEQVLVKSMRQKMGSNDKKDRCIVESFLLQLSSSTASHNNSSDDDNDDERQQRIIPGNPQELLAALVGSDKHNKNDNNNTSAPSFEADDPSLDHKLLAIIRRNAFGPDYVNYEKIEQKWKMMHNNEKEKDITTNNNHNNKFLLPSRLLGLYPLAAMINHSCIPNALRVFAHGDYMIVHASADIKKNEEIVWSYLPPIQPYPIRRKKLQENHGFVCKCSRCQQEQQVLLQCGGSSIYDVPESLVQLHNSYNNERYESSTGQQFTESLAAWEKQTFSSTPKAPNTTTTETNNNQNSNNNNLFSNETKRYWKMGNANLYIHNLNVQLIDVSSEPSGQQQQQIRNNVLLQAMEMHFCFVSCHYACTEHLSIMHLCYEIVAVMHSSASNSDKSKTLPKVKFWTEQLKRAHLVRYGRMGNDINRVRAIMKHTQMVLRNRSGLDMVPHEFI